MNRYSPNKVSPDPEWMTRIHGQLGRSLSPGTVERADKIIADPWAKEAYDLLAREYRSVTKDYPRFAELVEICAVPGDCLNLPFIFRDRREQILMAKYARELIGPVQAISSVVGLGDSFRAAIFGITRHKDIGGRVVNERTPEGKRLIRDATSAAKREADGVPSDAQIIKGIEAVAKVFASYAAIPRKKGRPENLGENNVIVGLDHALMCHFSHKQGRYPTKAIPLLLRATFGRIITADNVRKVLGKST